MKTLHKKLLFIVLILLNTSALGQKGVLKSIQLYLIENSEALGLNNNDILNWSITDNFSSSNGIKHVHIVQNLNGINIQNGTANFTLDANDNVLNVASRLITNVQDIGNRSSQSSISAIQALEKAAQYLNIVGKVGTQLKSNRPNHFKFGRGNLSQEDIDVELAFLNDSRDLKLVWIVSMYELSAEHWWRIFIDAENGEELKRSDWVVSCNSHEDGSLEFDHCNHSPINPSNLFAPPPPSTDQYNVFALPVESPNHGDISLEVGPFNSLASPFGWHDVNGVNGHEYTITRGNNVFAYDDINSLDSPGYSPDGGPNLNFNFPLNLNQSPENYLDASITNLFYASNKVHDILYQSGFDEQSGNFQENNYGNGGLGSDYILAEAQDGERKNNANFATPPDGFNPKMQMFLFDSNGGRSEILEVNSPASIAGMYSSTEAAFGPGIPAQPLIGELVLVDDGTLTTGDGCDLPFNSAELTGNIAVIYRGDCTFALKIENAQNNGAIAVIMINNVSGRPVTMGGDGSAVNIPSIMLSNLDGAILIEEMNTGTVNVTLSRSAPINFDIDSGFDNGIVIHEVGHGVSNRLTGGASNSDCLVNDEQMGEGWSDFLACMLTMDMSANNPVYRPIGTYARSQAINGRGIRNAAYDTSFAVNNYTYGDVADEFNISMPHGVGFVWATMLWDLNWAFIDKYGFDSNIETGSGGNNMVLELVIEGLKLQPCSPGFVDGRDAIILADELINNGDNSCLIWKVFAKRGLGLSADQGSSDSRTDQIEAFDVPDPPACKDVLNPPTANINSEVFSNDFEILLFPNPATNETNLNFSKALESNAALEIYTISGKLVQEITIPAETTDITIPLSNMGDQIYYLVFNCENGTAVKKLVVHK